MIMESRYALPESRDKVIKILDIVPEGWAWNGKLIAPREAYEQGRVAHNTEMKIENGNSPCQIELNTETAFPFGEPEKFPNPFKDAPLDEIVLGGKMPAIVALDGIHDIFEHTARKAATFYLKQGYKGEIEFSKYGHWQPESKTDQQTIEISHDKRLITGSWERLTEDLPKEIAHFFHQLDPLYRSNRRKLSRVQGQ